MYLNVFRYAAFMLLITALIGACASGKKEYDIGLSLNSEGKYKDAIAYLEQAIAKEPKNQQYQQALKQVKESLITRYVKQASDILTSQDPSNLAAINNARSKLAEAKEIDASHPQVVALSKEINEQNETLTREVEALYRKTKQHIAATEWSKAYFTIQQIQARFPNYEDTFQLMNRIRTEGVLDYHEKAQKLYEQEDFKGAAALLKNALALDGEHQPSRELLELASQNDNKEYFLEKAQEAKNNKNWDRAVKCYERALEFDSTNDVLIRQLVQIKSNAGNYYAGKAASQISTGFLFSAYENFVLAQKYLENPNDFRITGIKKDLISRSTHAANYYKEQGHFGSAWYCYKKIESIDPSYPGLFQLTLAMEDKINERVKKSIAVFDFNSPSDNQDAGIIVANNLITYLFKNASGDIKILERENLKSILEEMKLGQIGVVSEATAKEMGRVYGIDVAIMGSVLLYKVDYSSSESTKTVRYQVSTRLVDNEEYINWKAKHPDPSDKELETAPRPKIKVPEYAEKDYSVSNHKKVGFVQLSFRIVDIATGENVQVKTIERKEVAEDEASAGIPAANIKYDPVEMPTDTELLQKMTEEVVAELGREVLKPMQNLETIYFQNGETLLRRRNDIQAAESFVNAIFDEKLKMVQDSPLMKKAQQNLDEIFGNQTVPDPGVIGGMENVSDS